MDESEQSMADVSLQISVAPQDLPHAREILPHQLRQWGAQVGEVVFTLDLGPDDRDGEVGVTHQRREIEELLAELCGRHRHARIAHVDYDSAAVDAVSRTFFAGKPVPRKDCYGKVVYPYFFGLLAARHRFVLHMDSDMLFGGGSSTWVGEARTLLHRRPETFSCSPLPGPPSGRPLTSEVASGHARSRRRRAVTTRVVPFAASDVAGPAFRLSRVSTRDFMIDRSRFDHGAIVMRARRASARNLLAAVGKGRVASGDPRYAPAEDLLSRAMHVHGMTRVDFLGRPPGMWSVHPATRSEAFLRLLPDLVRRIEDGEVSDAQRGDYDLHDSMLDLASAASP
ncbi:MAG: hypothetical protein ACXVFQ_22210 [Solirubrobacteraceae bacterium]